VLGTAVRLPLDVWRLEALAAPAFQTAITLGMSVYDACYVVIAQSLGATLVTADRRLATAVSDAELIPVNGRG
jgi:predicted nucleic acid-binding protein